MALVAAEGMPQWEVEAVLAKPPSVVMVVVPYFEILEVVSPLSTLTKVVTASCWCMDTVVFEHMESTVAQLTSTDNCLRPRHIWRYCTRPN